MAQRQPTQTKRGKVMTGKKMAAAAILLFLFSGSLRLLFIGNIEKLYFDEINYVYDAAKYLNGILYFERESQSVPKHPMVSTFFMAMGIKAFGLNYFGWRIFSVVFGSLTAVMVFLMASQFFSWRASILAGLLFSLSFLHIAFSRMADVDIYFLFFVVSAFYFLARHIKEEEDWTLACAGALFGVGLATKWPTLLFQLIAFILFLLLSRQKAKLDKSLLYLILLPLVTFLTLSILLNLSAGMIIPSWAKFEIRNFHYHQIFSYRHPHNAPALGWPIMLKTIPLYVEQLPGKQLKGVIGMENPAIIYLIFPVMGYLIYRYLRERNPSILFILVPPIGYYLGWLSYDLFGSGRGLFFYYFMPFLPFYIIGLAFILDEMFKHRIYKRLAVIYLIGVVVFTIFFSPIIYGYTVTKQYYYHLIWVKEWGF